MLYSEREKVAKEINANREKNIKNKFSAQKSNEETDCLVFAVCQTKIIPKKFFS